MWVGLNIPKGGDISCWSWCLTSMFHWKDCFLSKPVTVKYWDIVVHFWSSHWCCNPHHHKQTINPYWVYVAWPLTKTQLESEHNGSCSWSIQMGHQTQTGISADALYLRTCEHWPAVANSHQGDSAILVNVIKLKQEPNKPPLVSVGTKLIQSLSLLKSQPKGRLRTWTLFQIRAGLEWDQWYQASLA